MHRFRFTKIYMLKIKQNCCSYGMRNPSSPSVGCRDSERPRRRRRCRRRPTSITSSSSSAVCPFARAQIASVVALSTANLLRRLHRSGQSVRPTWCSCSSVFSLHHNVSPTSVYRGRRYENNNIFSKNACKYAYTFAAMTSGRSVVPCRRQ